MPLWDHCWWGVIWSLVPSSKLDLAIFVKWSPYLVFCTSYANFFGSILCAFNFLSISCLLHWLKNPWMTLVIDLGLGGPAVHAKLAWIWSTSFLWYHNWKAILSSSIHNTGAPEPTKTSALPITNNSSQIHIWLSHCYLVKSLHPNSKTNII